MFEGDLEDGEIGQIAGLIHEPQSVAEIVECDWVETS
jgi:hypothetical protein